MISRGFGGKGGNRSIITLRGGAGSGGTCLEQQGHAGSTPFDCQSEVVTTS